MLGPVGSPWMWTLAFGHHEDRTPTHGYATTREAAMAAFAKSWRRYYRFKRVGLEAGPLQPFAARPTQDFQKPPLGLPSVSVPVLSMARCSTLRGRRLEAFS
jgi:hypothetical protein